MIRKYTESFSLEAVTLRRNGVPLTVFLSSSLREYVPGYDPSSGLSIPNEEGITIAELCLKLSLPTDKIKIVMVNGRKEDLAYVLQGDERLGFFPPVGGG